MKKIFERIKGCVKNEDGAVMILVTFFMVILLGFAALAFDYAIVYYRQSQLQTAVDTAARAASRIIVDDSLTDEQIEQQCKFQVKKYLDANGFPTQDVKAYEIEYSADAGVSIDVKSDVALNFARIFTDKPIEIKAGSTALTTWTETEGEKLTVDVAFVLDISGSMYNNDDRAKNKLKPMINAVNSAIKSILQYNPNNRVSVTVYSSPGQVKELISLTSCPSTVSQVRIKNGKRYTTYCFNEQCSPIYIGYNVAGERLVVAGEDGYIYQTVGGTFVQAGISQACRALEFSADDGITRVPSVFIMSDGEATYGQTNYCSNITNANLGDGTGADYDGYKFTHEIGYYTVLTANHWKRKLSEIYTQRNGEPTTAMFYSLGYNLNETTYKDYAAGVLNPATLDEGTSTYIGERLKNQLNSVNNPFGKDYYYADKYYEATGSEQLAEVLKDFASEVVKPVRTYNTRLTR